MMGFVWTDWTIYELVDTCAGPGGCRVSDSLCVCSAGRILNRFSKDINQMDSMLPITFVDFYQVRSFTSFILCFQSFVVGNSFHSVLPVC